jgi:hypothetical protein
MLSMGLLAASQSGIASASASDLTAWSCSFNVPSFDTTVGASSSGTAQCLNAHTSSGTDTFPMSLTVTTSSSPTGCARRVTGTIEVSTSYPEGVYSDEFTLTPLAAGEVGTFDVASGASGIAELNWLSFCVSPTVYPTQLGGRFASAGTAEALSQALGDDATQKSDGAVTSAVEATAGIENQAAEQDGIPLSPSGLLEDGYNYVRGVQSATGDCVYSFTIGLKADESSRSAHQVSSDPEGCAIGVVVIASGAPVPGASADASPGDGSGLLSCTPDLQALACAGAYKESKGYADVDLVDTTSGNVQTTSHSHLDFHYGNGCVHNPITTDLWWAGYGGWSLTNHDSTFKASCEYTSLGTTFHWHKAATGQFCLPFTSDWEETALIYGEPDGGLYEQVAYRITSPCRSLLKVKDRIVRE